VRLRHERKDHVWSYNFVAGRTSDGRAFRLLTVIDEYIACSLISSGSWHVSSTRKPGRNRRGRIASMEKLVEVCTFRIDATDPLCRNDAVERNILIHDASNKRRLQGLEAVSEPDAIA
jgi:hypothetical protein